MSVTCRRACDARGPVLVQQQAHGRTGPTTTILSDIAVPLELVPTFAIPTASNQSIWMDVYVPKTAPAASTKPRSRFHKVAQL